MKISSFFVPFFFGTVLAFSSCLSTNSDATKTEVAVVDKNSSPKYPQKVIKSTWGWNDEDKSKDNIKLFYLHLLDSDATVKREFDRLTAESRENRGPHFRMSDPQVVEWLPSEHSWDIPEEFQAESNYLVIQPIGYGRSRHSGYDTVIVSEFRVVEDGKAIDDESLKKNPNEPMSTTTTLSFLGFRYFQLNPLGTQNKATQQGGTGQPATRPESKSEGSDKPQSEAEGRSR